MQASSLVWNGVTQAQVAALIASLPSKGFTISPRTISNDPAVDAFSVEGHSVSADVAYDTGHGTLTVSDIDKPFYITMGMIHDLIAKALASVATQ
jgi:hypothetical protein